MLTENKALEYLKRALPEADKVQVSDSDLNRVISHTFDVINTVPWGKSIPEDVLCAFVLFPRVNNEDPVFYQQRIWSELALRLQGKSMEQAVYEVNYWCYEHATYQATDGRTANPITIITRAFGRCGEESTLLVSALRSCGIPARQVYVPRWAHCDDNHAWVEVWVDGVWHYMGACEPEPVLDSGWFTAAASKAMLVHTRAYGLIPEGEEIASVEGVNCILNRTAAYAETRRLHVKVTANGKPAAGFTVRFELANMAELYPIHTGTTDENGEASLLTGLGTLHIHVTDGVKYVYADADNSVSDTIALDFGNAVEYETKVGSFDQHAPVETRIQPAEYPKDMREIHEKRMRCCEKIRADYEATFDREDRYLKQALGNHAEVRAFINNSKYEEKDKCALLDTLRFKDFADVTSAVLEDALETALKYKNSYPENIWQEAVLAHRVSNEMLYPDRAELAERFADCVSAAEIEKKLDETLAPADMTPATIIPRFTRALEKGRASGFVKELIFVAACRARGIVARLNPATREVEVYENGAYRALKPAKQADSMLTLINNSGENMVYGAHFSVGVLENGAYRSLYMYDQELKDSLDIPVFSGRYRVITVRRQIDGCVDGRTYFIEVKTGEKAELEIAMRPNLTAEKRLNEELPLLRADGGILPDGNDQIVAVIAPGEEPTEHLLNELLESADEIRERSIKVRLIVDNPADTDNAKLNLVLEKLPGVSLYTRPDHKALIAWREKLHAGDLRLPFAAAVNKTDCGLFAFVNYHVGSVRSLIDILGA